MHYYFFNTVAQICQKRKQEVILMYWITSYGDHPFGELQAQKGVKDLDELEQPSNNGIHFSWV